MVHGKRALRIGIEFNKWSICMLTALRVCWGGSETER